MIATKAYYGDIRQNFFHPVISCLSVHERLSIEFDRKLEGLMLYASGREEAKNFLGGHLKDYAIIIADFWVRI